MCKYNIHCQELNCQCQKRLSAFRVVPAQAYVPMTPFQPNMPVLQLIQHQTELIKTISQQTAEFMAVLAQVSTKLDFFARSPGHQIPEYHISDPYAGTDELSRTEDIQLILTGPKTDFSLHLRLISPLPEPVFKERAFSLTCEVIDGAGNRAVYSPQITCKLCLFSYEKPAKLLKTNTSGDKVMHGSIETQVTEGLCVFPNVVIKEVTSHFKNGCFFLAVAASDNTEVQPLILENVIVKARRVNADGKPRKRQRPEA